MGPGMEPLDQRWDQGWGCGIRDGAVGSGMEMWDQAGLWGTEQRQGPQGRRAV